MISILLPTRKRPDKVLRLLESLNETVTDKKDVEVVIRYDDDDEMTREALPLFPKVWKNITAIQLGRPSNYGVLWNEALAVARGDILMVCGDDIVFRSNNWDGIVRYGFDTNPDGIVLLFGRDGFHDLDMATHPFIHRNWIKTVGYLGGGKSFTSYLDRWLNDIALVLGRRIFFAGIYTEHMHAVVSKAEDDEVYQASRVYMDTNYSLTKEQEIEQAFEVEALKQAIVDFGKTEVT